VHIGSGRILSTAGREFKNLARIELMKQLTGEESVNPQHWHRLTLRFFFPNLYTKTKGAKSRFVRMDTANREKITTDLLAEIFAFDDCCIKELVLTKDEGAHGVDIVLEDLES
jgi:hypothetical protein